MVLSTARNGTPTLPTSFKSNNGQPPDHGAVPETDRMNQRFLDPEQAATFLGGLNSRTVTRWAREGYLPAYPIGEGKRRLWRFLESDLERWMLLRGTGPGPSESDPVRRTLGSAADAPIGGRFQ